MTSRYGRGIVWFYLFVIWANFIYDCIMLLWVHPGPDSYEVIGFFTPSVILGSCMALWVLTNRLMIFPAAYFLFHVMGSGSILNGFEFPADGDFLRYLMGVSLPLTKTLMLVTVITIVIGDVRSLIRIRKPNSAPEPDPKVFD